jgi:hypothetical protein
MDLNQDLGQYYQLPVDQQESIRKKILKIANSNPEKFKASVRSIDVETDDHLPVIYEALAPDTKRWGSFFIEEARRIIESASHTDKPYHILCLLDEFFYLDKDQFAERPLLIELLKKELENEHPTFRYFAVNLLPEFVEVDDKETIRLLQERLSDHDWRVRYWTHKNLQDMGHLPDGHKISFHDRFLSKMSNTMKFD